MIDLLDLDNFLFLLLPVLNQLPRLRGVLPVGLTSPPLDLPARTGVRSTLCRARPRLEDDGVLCDLTLLLPDVTSSIIMSPSSLKGLIFRSLSPDIFLSFNSFGSVLTSVAWFAIFILLPRFSRTRNTVPFSATTVRSIVAGKANGSNERVPADRDIE
jgi:hypothetical protein